MSFPFFKDQRANKNIVPFYSTRLNYNGTLVFLSLLEKAVHLLTLNPAPEENFFSKNVLTSTVRTNCGFVTKRVEGTRIANFVVAIIGYLWLFLLFLSLCTIWFRRTMLLDISNPMHWAKSLLNKDEIDRSEAVLVSLGEDEEGRKPFLMAYTSCR